MTKFHQQGGGEAGQNDLQMQMYEPWGSFRDCGHFFLPGIPQDRGGRAPVRRPAGTNLGSAGESTVSFSWWG